MIDEWLEEKIDRLCEWAPAYFSPRMTRFCGTRFGWRLTLYASAIKRRLWGALSSIKWMEDEAPQEEIIEIPVAADPSLEKLDPKTRQEIESWNDDLKTWTEKQEKERKKWRTPKERFMLWWDGRHEREQRREEKWAKREAAAEQRAQKHMRRLLPLMQRIESSVFAVTLFCTALCALGACAKGGGMGYMAAACCAMWLSSAMETGYPPIAKGVRQRYLTALMLRTASFLFLLPMYFEGYVRHGVSSNVILQSAMLILLFAHALLTLALVAFNSKQPLFLRALSGVLGVIPALTTAAAIAQAVTRLAMPPLEAAFSVIGAIGAVMAFCADRAATLHDLGGIRLRYIPVWTSLMMELGFLMMISGAWIAG